MNFQCRTGLPTKRTSWEKLQPLIAAAISDFLANESNQKMIKMQDSEDAITAELKIEIAKKLAVEYGDGVWNVTTNHNRVLENGSPKKQPTEYLLEAIEHFSAVRDGAPSEFQAYLLDRFKVNRADPSKDDFMLARAHFKTASEKVANDMTFKNLTKPDLIVHELGCLTRLEHNLIAFEVKPKWSQQRYYSLLDLARMKAFTVNKNPPDHLVTPVYQFGLFLYFTKTEGLHTAWRFENGVQEPVPFKIL